MPILIWKNPIITSNATDTNHEETISKFTSPEITCQIKCTHYLKDVLIILIKTKKKFTVFNPLKKLTRMSDTFSGLEDLIKNFLRRNTTKLTESRSQIHNRDFISKYFLF